MPGGRDSPRIDPSVLVGLSASVEGFPLVVLSQSVDPWPEVYDSMETFLLAIYGQGQRVVLIFDAALPSLPSADIRRRAANVEIATERLTKHWSAARIVVLRSRILRGGMKAVQWLAPSATTARVVASPGEAAEVARAELESAGIDITEEMEAVLAELAQRP